MDHSGRLCGRRDDTRHDKRIQRAVLLLLVAVASLSLVEHVLKPTVDRRTLASAVSPPGPPVFPSGQATVLGVLASIALTTEIGPRHQRLRRPLQLVTIATVVISSVGLVYSGCHYPTDVVGGLGVGVALAELALALSEKAEKALTGRPPSK